MAKTKFSSTMVLSNFLAGMGRLDASRNMIDATGPASTVRLARTAKPSEVFPRNWAPITCPRPVPTPMPSAYAEAALPRCCGAIRSASVARSGAMIELRKTW